MYLPHIKIGQTQQRKDWFTRRPPLRAYDKSGS